MACLSFLPSVFISCLWIPTILLCYDALSVSIQKPLKNDSDLNIRWFSLVKVWIECGRCNEESCSCFLPIVWGLQKASGRPGLRVCSQWNGWMLTVSVLRSPLDQVLFYHLDILISNKNVGLDAEEGSALHSGLVPCIGAEAYMTTS